VAKDRDVLADVDELCRRRVAAGWGQRAVARQLGVNQTTISAWEARRRAIPAVQAKAYADLLDEIEAGRATP
jgi:transcriptional regulator with XRE-family HTH domain